jgi:deoxyribose-phosphate aldolase
MTMLLNRTIDHTLLKPDGTSAQIDRLCEEAIEHAFASVCVLPWHVRRAAEHCAGSDVAVCTVVGFPLGGTHTSSKLHEAMLAMDEGAREIDMVANITALKSGAFEHVLGDVHEVVKAVHDRAGIVKVIIETCLLDDEEKKRMCAIVTQAGADFIKTSTGFSTGGATVADVLLLRAHVGTGVQVKASGGIRDITTANAMLAAGATRLGTSSGVSIMLGRSS